MLEKESLTLSEAIHLARSLDTAQRNAEKYSLPAAPGDLSAVSTENPPPVRKTITNDTCASIASRRTCFNCGSLKLHPRSLCPARTSVCHKCRKIGHFAKVCRTGRVMDSRRGASTTTAAAVVADESGSGERSASSLEEVSFLPRDYCTYCVPYPATETPVLAAIATPRNSTIPVSVNELQVNALIDSGSTISFIHPDVVNCLDIPVHPSKSNITLAASQTSSTLVSTKDLAPSPRDSTVVRESGTEDSGDLTLSEDAHPGDLDSISRGPKEIIRGTDSPTTSTQSEPIGSGEQKPNPVSNAEERDIETESQPFTLRRSTRIGKAPDRLMYK
ncbi:hypothetical protein Pmani_008192 [Petrolisthes manimaculis]|uniref:CCHC-type domain-containing protein n=2 Tax=Petrolisthes manimaculis TaxID=1843537 RepID=A0AAE1Q9A8_9EUCA|nr:hypothetical protein Pmani_010616 [Petrolisthes manimaculis]KAK4320937.1 hypothetical protein Pmani_008192 [Petrolisthes manimaculis]